MFAGHSLFRNILVTCNNSFLNENNSLEGVLRGSFSVAATIDSSKRIHCVSISLKIFGYICI